MHGIEQFISFYQSLDQQNLSQLPSIYGEDVRFVDPVTEINGIAALTGYFEDLLAQTTQCDFTINNTHQSADNSVVLEWSMEYKHPKLKGGRLLTIDGISLLQLEHNKVVYQRDYYDMGAMLYEHIPVIGLCVKWLKRRLAH